MVLTLIKVISNNNYKTESIHYVKSVPEARQMVRTINQFFDTNNKHFYYEGLVEDMNTHKKYNVLYDGRYFSPELFEARCKQFKIGKYNN